MTECRRVIGSTTLREALRRCRPRDGWPGTMLFERATKTTPDVFFNAEKATCSSRSTRSIDTYRGFLPINFSPLTRCTSRGTRQPLEEAATVCNTDTSKGNETAGIKNRLFDYS